MLFRSKINFELASFGRSLDELLKADKILYGYYDSGYISIFHPAEQISIPIVREAVSMYCRDFLNIPFSKAHLLNRLKKGYARKTFEEEQKLRKESGEFTRKGDEYQVRLELQTLEDRFGGELSRIGGEIDYCFIRNGNYFVRLKDGSEQPIGPPKIRIIKH